MLGSITDPILERVCRILDIPDELYERAVTCYEDVGKWLAKQDQVLGRRPPEIYPQGSFRLGTMVRPSTEADQYDIDLVYERDLQKGSISQSGLKNGAGSLLGKYVKEHEQELGLKEGRRCWTLLYGEDFHMDVLPSIGDEEDPREGSILITDTELTRWQYSNPKGYAAWFREQMKVRLVEGRAALAGVLKVAIEKVPEWRVKTALQRSVQFLKRHRDLYFANNPNEKPASIILSTLAARAYRNEASIWESIKTISAGMPRYIDNRSGDYWVANPANERENFADRWRHDKDRRISALNWMEKVAGDVAQIDRATSDQPGLAVALGSLLGEATVREAEQQLEDSQRGAPSTVPSLGDSSHAERATFTVSPIHRVRVKASLHKNKGDSKALWAVSPARPVPAGFALRFEVDTNAARPFEVKWQVVNTGLEAKAAGQLRGEFYSSEPGNEAIRWETTKYAGTHWVEAFVMKGSACVGRSGKFLVRIRGG